MTQIPSSAPSSESGLSPLLLPALVTSTLGRQQEIEAVCALLRSETVRLLTLTGPGGVGKTRLCLEVARALRGAFADGIFFVSLGSLLDQELLLPTLARALGIEQGSSHPLYQRVQAFLAEKELLLVLDNFEHLQAAGVLVAELLTTTAKLKILVTSRARLHLYSEREYIVPPLALPGTARGMSLQELAAVPAVALFVERAQGARANFNLTPENVAVIVEICTRLDGLPLALELAAARIKFLSPQDLLARLYSVLSDGAVDLPARQRTLRATLDWSYALLTEEERRCFRRLGVLAGTWTLSTAEEICRDVALEEMSLFVLLTSLIDKSLVYQVEADRDSLRFTLLQTIREYALSNLALCDELQETRRVHALLFLRLVEQAQPYLRGQQQRSWLQQVEQEVANIWVALRWVLMCQDTALALRFGSALSDFLLVRSTLSEGHDWFEEILALPKPAGPAREEARVLYASGVMALMRSDLPLAQARLTESEAMATFVEDVPTQVVALGMQAMLALHRGADEVARSCIERGLERLEQTDDLWCSGMFYSCVGNVASKFCDFKQARKYYLLSLKVLRQLDDTRSEAEVLLNMGKMLRLWGKLRAASILYKRGLRLFQEVTDSWWQAACLNALGSILRLYGSYTAAEELLQECLELTLATGNKREQALALCELGLVAGAQSRGELARERLRESLRVMRDSGYQPGLAYVFWAQGELALSQQQLADAAAYFEQSLKVARNCADKMASIWALIGSGAVVRQQQDSLRAFALFKQALLLYREVNDNVALVRLFEELALLCWQVGLPEQAITLFSFVQSQQTVLELAPVPFMQEEQDTALAALQALSGEVIFQECWHTGSMLNVSLALNEVNRLRFSEKSSTASTERSSRSSSHAGLTPREIDVLRLVAAGYSDVRIASELVLSPRTINTHLRSIYAKLGVSSRSAATRFAFEHKLVE